MPIFLHRQISINKDVSEGILYLISNDIDLEKQSIETIYQKRWKVAVLHKSIKSNTGLAKSPAKTKKTKGKPYFHVNACNRKLECLSLKKGLTMFGLKTKLYIKAQKVAIKALRLVQVSTA